MMDVLNQVKAGLKEAITQAVLEAGIIEDSQLPEFFWKCRKRKHTEISRRM